MQCYRVVASNAQPEIILMQVYADTYSLIDNVLAQIDSIAAKRISSTNETHAQSHAQSMRMQVAGMHDIKRPLTDVHERLSGPCLHGTFSHLSNTESVDVSWFSLPQAGSKA